MSVCGTPEYLAPEVIRKQGHGKAVDWWCLGCIIYEMITGFPPFRNQNRMQLFEAILYQPLQIPNVITFLFRFLLKYKVYSLASFKKTLMIDWVRKRQTKLRIILGLRKWTGMLWCLNRSKLLLFPFWHRMQTLLISTKISQAVQCSHINRTLKWWMKANTFKDFLMVNDNTTIIC